MTATPTQLADGRSDEDRPNGDNPSTSLDIAIVGGGIIGVMMALGLLHRGMRVTLYERANDYHEIGAGFAFTGVARECMQRLNPQVLEALCRVGEENRHPNNRYWDGFNPTDKRTAESQDALLFQMSARELDYWGCLRSHFLRGMATYLPGGVVKFGKQMETYVDEEGSEKVVLHFTDGSVAEADAVIGCDGIHSRTRRVLLGDTHQASHASYSHKVAYRAIVPIADGISAIGHDKANNQCTHMGPDAHIVSFPVNKWTLLNLFVFMHDPEPWREPEKMTAPGTRDEVARALRNWSPAVRELVDLLPEHLTKWGIFDMAEHPAPTYAGGRVCIAGDAAHASSPFHGVGACMGVEDCLVLATALETTMATSYDGSVLSKASAISTAFQTYSAVRLERSHWLVESSREMGDIYEWRYAATGHHADKCKAEFERRSRKIWDFNVDKMVTDTESQCILQLKTTN
ncbi:putative salicylate hydroxylase [Hypoxylon sp. FL0543]|nr:putative salicylate hydroxylase [Hypoxylon sp. FL0543]